MSSEKIIKNNFQGSSSSFNNFFLLILTAFIEDMKKILVLNLLWMLISYGSLDAQTFDSTAYKQVYKEMFQKSYFGEDLSTPNKVAGLSKAWAEAKFNFANFDLHPKMNWDSIYYAYIPKVSKTNSKADYYKVLSGFYHQLNDGHSMIIAPQFLWDSLYATLPIRAKLVDDRVFITDLNSSKAEYSRLSPGTEILKINGKPVQQYSEENVAEFLSYSSPQDKEARLYSFFFTQGPIDEPVQLELRSPLGKTFSAEYKREVPNEPLSHGPWFCL